MLRVGIEGEGRLTVTENDTAAAVGSGSLRVFATPAMAALMEKTALTASRPSLRWARRPSAPRWTSGTPPPRPSGWRSSAAAR